MTLLPPRSTENLVKTFFQVTFLNGKALTTELVLWKCDKQGATLRERFHRTPSLVDRTGNNFKLKIFVNCRLSLEAPIPQNGQTYSIHKQFVGNLQKKMF